MISATFRHMKQKGEKKECVNEENKTDQKAVIVDHHLEGQEVIELWMWRRCLCNDFTSSSIGGGPLPKTPEDLVVPDHNDENAQYHRGIFHRDSSFAFPGLGRVTGGY
mmetsp:Transcript_48825/g.66540  ORF Transcript_48825/g.66540 Transcript_48825/m.66540 type:complete len:108 (-) Transcript_48825:85-408(-)